MNLLFLLIVPFLTALGVLAAKGLKQVRTVSFIGAALQLLLAFYLLVQYQQIHVEGDGMLMYFEQSFAWFPSLGISFHIGVDGISIAMILLTSLVVVAGILVSYGMEHLHKEFFFLLILLSLGAYGFFIALDIFTLFFFLEVAVIPKFLLIGIWGSGNKEKSAMKLALMLMGGSALIFVGLIGTYYYSNPGGARTFSLMELANGGIPLQAQLIFFPFLFAGFGVFTALFPFHTWVPDGHSSAPTAASMFLAGISMKLGGYGCLRVATFLMPVAAEQYAWIIILLATIAIIYGAFATLMQTDLKYINAYSSISHCGFVLLGIGMLNKVAITGAVMQMVSHGLMTALFFAAIGMMYSRTHTRLLAQLGGLLKVMPFISSIFIIAGLCSLGLPGFSGFVSEMTVFVGAWQNPDFWYRLATILSCASIVVTAVYILRAAGKSVMGPIVNQDHLKLSDALWNEKVAAVVLLSAIVIIGVAPFVLTDLLSPGTDVLMAKLLK
ncbi:MAG: NADH-quinone oxidoreductase subunit M [Bacteroidia bacterium]|nr:NADH-quinone oxidoreductase subunit M [Bacteroidia bacterium]MCF8425664.1 NADH-quinone oxidoreductase subunit M [Bacteroidia bacterium]MCF8447931.1 NADH-quinone oxidoreductase subunit M [Bacteroidia bacterium]